MVARDTDLWVLRIWYRCSTLGTGMKIYQRLSGIGTRLARQRVASRVVDARCRGAIVDYCRACCVRVAFKLV
jgi:hypothetical protein